MNDPHSRRHDGSPRRLPARSPNADVLASRCRSPAARRILCAQPVPVRSGGFGGAEGLASYLREERIDALIDATHPYAAQISANAARAAALRQRAAACAAPRRPGRRTDGDQWIEVADHRRGGRRARRRAPPRLPRARPKGDRAVRGGARHMSIWCGASIPSIRRSPCPHAIYLTARGPFSEADDRALLERHRIDVVVAKNSGGEATYGKIAAARALHLPVIMLQRPTLPEVDAVRDGRRGVGLARSCEHLRRGAWRVDERLAPRRATMSRVSGEPTITSVAMSASISARVFERRDRHRLVRPARPRGRTRPASTAQDAATAARRPRRAARAAPSRSGCRAR